MITLNTMKDFPSCTSECELMIFLQSDTRGDRWLSSAVICLFVIFSVWCRHAVWGGVERRGMKTDKNNCDGNEECSACKGLAATPEVCFRSLISRTEKSMLLHNRIGFKLPDNSLLDPHWHACQIKLFAAEDRDHHCIQNDLINVFSNLYELNEILKQLLPVLRIFIPLQVNVI